MAQPVPVNTGSTSDGAAPQPSNTDETRAPTSRPSGVPISLPRRAPVEILPARIRRSYLKLSSVSIESEDMLERKVQCIRSQRVYKQQFTITSSLSPGLEYSTTQRRSGSQFLYPEAFRRAEHELRAQQRPLTDVESRLTSWGDRAAETGHLALGVGGPSGASTTVNTDGHGDGSGPVQQLSTTTVGVGLKFNCFGVTRSSVTKVEVPIQPTYVVLGIFRHGSPQPEERVVFVHKPEHLFRKLHWAAYRLRGFRGTFFSLTHCDVNTGTHERVELDSNGKADLQLLLSMYKKQIVSHSTARIWAEWIYRCLNNGSNDVTKGTYALELVIGWSMARITVVVLLPVLLSLAVGLYLNAQNWRDLTTIQTAWGTASYVVTTGGLLAALLAILSGIEHE